MAVQPNLSDLVGNPEDTGFPYKNEKVAARLQLGWCYYAAIKYVCNNWWRQSSQLERLVACLQQPCSFYQRLQANRATTQGQLQLAAVTSKKTARTHSLNKLQLFAANKLQLRARNLIRIRKTHKPQCCSKQ